MLKQIILLLIVIIELSISALIGFLLFPSWGEYWGAGIFLVLLAINLTFGERLLVALGEGRLPIVGDPSIDSVRNVASLKGLSQVQLYYTSKFSSQVIVIQKKESESFIVVGQKLIEKLSTEELRALLKMSLDKLARGEAKYATHFTLTTSLHLPLLIFSNIKQNKVLNYLGVISSYLGTPFNYFMYKCLKLVNSSKKNTEESRDLTSALFKMRKIRFETKTYKGQNIVDHLDIEPIHRSPIVHRLLESMEKPI